MSSVKQLKVLTLNCWGVFVPVVCKLKTERMKAIQEELAKGVYDIILLQEVWTQTDYSMLCSALLKAFPHSHYFHSGNYGSGVCIFSKYIIYDTAQFAFTLNGYPHRVLCGDWFCRKCVGLCKILVDGIRVYVYSAHLHAQYRDPDDYEAHRIVQSFQMAQFIRHTGAAGDVIIVGGDFNYSPTQLGYDVIKDCAGLEDAWLVRKNKSAEDIENSEGRKVGYMETSNRPDNSFHNSLDHNPAGQTLDFIMFRHGSGYKVECESCYLTMQKVSGQAYNYSDHEGVAAVLNIQPDQAATVKQRDIIRVEETLNAVLPILDTGYQTVKSSRVFYFFMASLWLLILLMMLYSEWLDFIPRLMEFSCDGILLLVTIFYMLMATLWVDRELNGLLAVQKEVKIALRAVSKE